MSATVVQRTAELITIQIQIELSSGSLLESEEKIQAALNEAGTLATGEALEKFDTDGSKLEKGGLSWSSKGKLPKTYQTPYGKVEVHRHVYQKNSGGATYCPLESNGRIILTSTPKFAQQVSHKYAEMSSPRLVKDLEENHGRKVTRSFVQNLAEAVGTIAQLKEEDWHYQTPKLAASIPTISVGVDGTCLLLCHDGGREAMVGTISLYNPEGERQHTLYIAASPEYGKSRFLERMNREVAHIKHFYPDAHYQGLADGAADNWTFLEPLTHSQLIDFYHATLYVGQVAKAMYPESAEAQTQWMATRCHDLKHKVGAAEALLQEMQGIEIQSLSQTLREGLQSSITYFQNHHHQMSYAEALAQKLPIGSGVTESACKLIVKSRFCSTGMKWKEQGVSVVLSLRTLSYSDGRWQQFWSKIDQYGFDPSKL